MKGLSDGMRGDVPSFRIFLVVLAGAACWGTACGDETARPLMPGTGGGGAGADMDGGSATEEDASSSDAYIWRRDRHLGPPSPLAGAGGSIYDEDSGSVVVDGGEVSSGGPNVEIIEPTSASDANEDTVLTEAPVKVRCRVSAGLQPDATEVDVSSVMIALMAGDEVIEEKLPTDVQNDVFEVSFSHSELSSGPLAFRCTANDTSEPPRTSTDRVETFFDFGPEIEVISPLSDTSYPLAGTVEVEFRVVPQPLSAQDTESDVAAVRLTVAGVDVEAEEVASEDGLYRVFVDFSDGEVFPDTPVGSTPIVIAATNSRTPEAATRIVNYRIIIDGQGPIIEINEPEDGSIEGGEVILKFTISDEHSGVDNDTVVVELNDEPHPYDPLGQWHVEEDAFTFRFDTRNVQGSIVQITINIDADDAVGNSALSASMVIFLDNQPPLVDLDPPMVREEKESGEDIYCSWAFDPVGEAVNNYDTIPNMALFRSVVWDITNSVPGQRIYHFSTVDRDKVHLYVQDDTDTALLIDTDGDSFCDDLDVSGLPDLKMDAIAPTGEPFWGGPDGDNFSSPPVVTHCDYEDGAEPDNLCTEEVSDMTRVIAHWLAGGTEPAIYGVNITSDLSCTGAGWEIGAFIEEGPACLAVRAYDHAGNIGISRPLVVCLDDPYTATDECDVDLTEIDCSDGCTPPVSIAETGIFDTPLVRK